MKFANALFLLALLLLPRPAPGRESVVVGAFEYPPVYQDAPNPGLACEIVLAAFDAADVDARLEFLPVLRMIQSLAKGNVPCAIGGEVLFREDHVRPAVSLSAPFMFVLQTFIFDSSRFPDGVAYSSLEDLRHLRIGVLNGSGVMRYLSEPAVLSLDKNVSHEGSAKQLRSGRIDLWGIVDLTGMLFLQTLFPDEASRFSAAKPFNRGDISLAVSNLADPDAHLLRAFETGLAAIKANGKYLDIMAKYYGSPSKINPEALSDDVKATFSAPKPGSETPAKAP